MADVESHRVTTIDDSSDPSEPSRRKFDIVVATSLPHPVTNLEAIGAHGSLPWHCPADLRHFRSVTSMTADSNKRNAIIMGRRTWKSLDDLKLAPLATRLNCVITSAPHIPGADASFSSLSGALEAMYSRCDIESIFVIGGGRLYEEAIDHPDLSMIIKTVIHMSCPADADTFFPQTSRPKALSMKTCTHVSTRPYTPSYHVEFWRCE